MYRITPPLPLVKFETNLDDRLAKTITGESIPAIPNKLYGSNEKADKINDPIQCRKLAKWFAARSQQEATFRQIDNYKKTFSTPELLPEDKEYQKIELFDCTVFESYLYVESLEERHARNDTLRGEQEQMINRARQNAGSNSTNLGIADVHDEDNKSVDSYRSNKSSDSSFNASNVADAAQSNPPRNSPTALYRSPSIAFDAEFESGNLEKAVRVIGRENLLTERHLQSLGEYAAPADVDQEYDLTIRNDINTDGNIQWYYFAVKFEPYVNYTFPLSVRFNLVNMQKKDSLYNYGMKPAVYAEGDAGSSEGDWGHDGSDVSYYRNGLTNLKVVSSRSKKKKNVIRAQYSLSFTYTFKRPGTVYFAHTFPYTYSDLQRFLLSLESNDYVHRRPLCETIAGNVCDMLTITERCENVVESKNKPAIILSARIHPGESMSSFMIQGCIEYLLSDCLEAKRLRKAFIFIIVPMLNPDGVVHGNYRCSLAGSDLNRRYKDTNSSIYPTIAAFKELFQATQTRRPILLFLDLHGHSKVKNAFLYGCDLTYQPDKIVKFLSQNMSEEDINNRRLYARLYPKILCTLSKANYNGYFSYNDCAFAIQKNKGGTGRVFGYRECGIIGSYTIEASFCGNGDNNEKKLLKKMDNSIAASNRASQAISGSGAAAAALLASNSAMNSDTETARSSDDNNAPLLPGNTEYISDDNEEDIEEEQERASSPPLEDSFKGKQAATPLTFKALLDRDPVLNRLITSYRTQVHYTKQDLLNMGRHIVYAIYHYTNLTHADLDEEVEQLVTKEKEDKERIINQVEYENKAQAAGIVRKERRLSTLMNSVTSSSLSSRSGKGHYADPIHRSDSPSCASNDTFAAINKMQALELKLKASGDESDDEEDNDNVDKDGDAELEENADNDDNISKGSDADVDDRAGMVAALSSKLNIGGSSKLNSNSNNAYLQEILQQHLRSQVVVYDENNIAHKSLTRAGVLSVSALSQLIQQYSSEFALLEKSTMNIGIRIKTELLLRKTLRLDDSRIRLDQKLITSLDSYNVAENDDRSVSGSESNPSVDNNQAISSRLLSKTGNLVSALRKVNLQKKSLQDLSNTKYQIKLMNKLFKQKQKQLKARAEQADKDAQTRPVIPKPRPSTAPRNSQLRMTMPKREPMYRYSVDVGAVKVAPVTIQLMSSKDLDRSRLTELQHQQQHQNSLSPNQPRYNIINTNRQSINMSMAGQGVAMQSVNVGNDSATNSPRSNRGNVQAPMTIVSSTIPQHLVTPSPAANKVSITPLQSLGDSASPGGSSSLPPTVPIGYTSAAFSASVGSSKSNKAKRAPDDNTFFVPHAMPPSNYSGSSSPSLSVVAPVMSHNILQTTVTPSPSRPSTPKMYYHTLQPPSGSSSPLVAPLKSQGGGPSRGGANGNSGGRTRSSLPDILPLLASPTRASGDANFFSGVKKGSSLSVKEMSAELMITPSPIGGSFLNRGQEQTRATFPRPLEQTNLFSPPSSARKL